MSAAVVTNAIDELERKVRVALRASDLSSTEIGERAAIHPVNVRKFRAGTLKLLPETLERLAIAVGLELKITVS